MSCKKCGSNKDKCGCRDQALTTPVLPPCDPNAPVCPVKEPCPEIFDSKCITYQGDPIADYGINPGDRLEEIIQKLLLLTAGTGCVLESNTCQSILNLHTLAKTTTTITIAWDASPNATSYTTEYKLASAGSFTLNTSVIPPVVQDTIGGLIPDTDYHIRVNTICSVGNCYSLTILVRTNA